MQITDRKRANHGSPASGGKAPDANRNIYRAGSGRFEAHRAINTLFAACGGSPRNSSKIAIMKLTICANTNIICQMNETLPVQSEDLAELVFAAIADRFAALAEPTRLRIVYAICLEEKSVNAIAAEVATGQANVSRHLALMHRTGLVGRRRQGNQILYRVIDEEMLRICQSVCARVVAQVERMHPGCGDLSGHFSRKELLKR